MVDLEPQALEGKFGRLIRVAAGGPATWTVPRT